MSSSNVEEVDDLPELGDDAVVFNLVAADGQSGSIMFFQDGVTLYVIGLASLTEHQPETVIELAEAQVERMDEGDCDIPLAVPDALLG